MRFIAVNNIIARGKLIEAGEEIVPDALSNAADKRPKMSRDDISRLVAEGSIEAMDEGRKPQKFLAAHAKRVEKGAALVGRMNELAAQHGATSERPAGAPSLSL